MLPHLRIMPRLGRERLVCAQSALGGRCRRPSSMPRTCDGRLADRLGPLCRWPICNPALRIRRQERSRRQHLEIYLQLRQKEEFEVDREACDVLKGRKEHIGDDGILLCTLQGGPLGSLIRTHAGVENTAFLAFDAPELFREYTPALRDNHLRRLKVAIGCCMDGVINVSSMLFRGDSDEDTHSWEWWREGYNGEIICPDELTTIEL